MHKLLLGAASLALITACAHHKEAPVAPEATLAVVPEVTDPPSPRKCWSWLRPTSGATGA